ncbi:pilin [Candidatus Gracilibacteria bacterium]|nr:pilin [Candidatus Gracilibacteria bacterium]
MKKVVYGLIGLGLSGLNSAHAAITTNDVQTNIQGRTESADIAVQNIVANFMIFLAIIAVLYLLWGGFQILTAGGDEEKVTKGKTIIIQAGLGLLVIFLANSIVQWVLGIITQ